MSEPLKPEPREWAWTLSQRKAMIVLLAIFLGALSIRLLLNSRYVPDPQPPQGVRASELASRLDPNIADWQALAAIPNLGEKRARDIVAYRDRMRASKPQAVVFKSVNDLRAIRGIGPATVERLRAYLIFPGEAPTSGPGAAEDADPAR